MVKKIISGGQTGVDRTALEVAKEKGLETGGTVPKGYRTDEGPAPELVTKFGCVEDNSTSYPPRTRKNVQNSDATVWFGDMTSPGYLCTMRAAVNYRKPMISNPSVETLRIWLEAHQVKVLNVAGNRMRTHPKSSEQARQILMEVL